MTFPHSVLSWALVLTFLGLVDVIVGVFLSFMEDTVLQSWSSGSGLLPHLLQCSESQVEGLGCSCVGWGSHDVISSFLSPSPAAPTAFCDNRERYTPQVKPHIPGVDL